MRAQRLRGAVLIAFIVFVVMCLTASVDAAEYAFTKPSPNSSAIACMKSLPDGAKVCIHNKSVIGISINDIYVAEPDYSSGIRINTTGIDIPVDLEPGAIISCVGVMATENGFRYINNAKDISFKTLSGTRIGSLAMSSPAIMGWPVAPKKPFGPRITGLLPVNQLVTIWGRVMLKGASDSEGLWYIYIDDGWGKKDGSDAGCTGIRVYCDSIPPDNEPFQVAVGVLSAKLVDPTPFGPDGDEVVIPIIKTTFPDDVYPAYSQQQITHTTAPVSGRVRLIGQSTPGMSVRIYSEHESVILNDVTDSWENFTINNISADGGVLTVSAPGYLSETVNVRGGDTNIDVELQPSDVYIEGMPLRSSIAVCSDESAPIEALCRDYEGKGISGRQLKMTTTLGVFAESQSKQLIATTDASGYVEGHITAASDGAGTAFIAISDYPDETNTAFTEVHFLGPQISMAASQYYFDKAGYTNITATVTCDGTNVAGELLTFKTNWGVFQQSNQPTAVVMTDQDGKARATLQLRSPGTALVTASYYNHCSQGTVNWLTIAYETAPWYSQGASYCNPLVTDLNGLPDGKKETLFIDNVGTLVALDASGATLWSLPKHPGGSNTLACAKLDSLRSGLPAIFVPAESQQRVYAYTSDGHTLAGWPTGTDYVTKKGSVAVGDVNLDGSEEIVVGDECCFVFAWNPTGDWKGNGSANDSFIWKNLTGTQNTAIFGSSCAIGDLNGDPQGMPDVAVGTNNGPEAYAFPGDAWGNFVSKPYYLPGWPRSTGIRVESSPALGDIDGDGRNDYAMGCDGQSIFVWLSGDDSWTKYPLDGIVRSSPALCDLDVDGKLDIVVGTNNGRVYAINWRGQSIDGWSDGIILNGTGIYAVESSPVIGDINGDGQVEVVIGCGDGNVYAIYKDGRNHQINGELTGPIAWVGCCIPPGASSAQITTAPVIDDIDNDGKVDILAASSRGVYIHHLNAAYSSDPSLYPWPTFHHDNQRTGCTTAPPAPVNASIQGIVTKNGVPVTQARIYVYNNDGSIVYQPYSNPPAPRNYVLTVGGEDLNERAGGSYCISQLEPNTTYKIKVEANNEPAHWVNDIAVTTGLVRVDIEL